MMLYNRNILRKRMEDERRHTMPDRDAVVWSVDTNNFYCLVKVQGSDTTIKAHYPRNWKTQPIWLKPGNSVQIRHKGGAQRYVEVIGHGRSIPTPVEGEMLPTPDVLTDRIMSGMQILEHTAGGMNVTVAAGTYRISGTIYTYTVPITGFIIMDDPAPMVMGVGTKMGLGETITPVAIAAAPAAGLGRYDALVIGIDSTIDVLTGAAVALTTEPTKPDVTASHVLIGYLFIYAGMTDIPAALIGIGWSEPRPVTIETASSMKQGDGTFEFPWDGGDDTPEDSITFSVKDQYGQAFAVSADAVATLLDGTGGVGTTGGGSFGATATKTCGTSVIFWYQRNQIASPEVSPFIKIEFTGWAAITYLLVIVCLDVGGDPV